MSRIADDGEYRLLIRDGLDHTVIVEAAAGTGKTTELVWRILNVVSSGRARIDQIVAVTFTEKAAGELKLRIRQELETARQRAADPESQSRLTDAIERLEEAHVSTIHGFCADLLRERPVEAGVDPLFEVLTEPRAERLFSEAFHAWLDEQLEEPGEGVRRALRRSAWSPDGGDRSDGPIDRLRRAARDLAEWRDFTGVWRRDPFNRDAALNLVLAQVRQLAALSASPASDRDPLFLGLRPIREFAHEIETVLRVGQPDNDGWEARSIDLAQNRQFRRVRRGREKTYGPGIDRDAVWTAYERLTAELDDFQRAADADLAALLHVELAGAIAHYETAKRRAGALDFVDLLLRTRELLVNHPAVRRAFQARFTHLFVDEFQDTDPLQAEILLLLAADDPSVRDWRRIVPIPGKLFLVGDPKQAIYRFRRADVEIYQEVCDLLESRGARRAYLRTSFRATPNIQRVVNAAFAPLMDGNRTTLQAQYVELHSHRPESADQPSVVVLPVPEPYGQQRVAGYAIDKSLPKAVGAFVRWLLFESGWTVTERTTRDELPISVPVQPRHVCILFRRFLQFGRDVTRPYVEALEARGVPHLLVGGKSFHDREEVETMRAALCAIEWPDDEVSVFATLRGALFAIDDETLFLHRQRHRTLHPFRVPADPEFPAVAEALSLLRRLHSRRNYRPIADTLTELLTATRAHVGFVLRSAGEQVLANVLHVAELARQYESNGGISFRGFVEVLNEQADGGQTAEAPILEEGTDGVRLMTTHKAKGLEFPIVILADMTARLRSDRADRLIDRTTNACYLRLGRWTPSELAAAEAAEVARDEAEGVRVAYVAATRARDLLVVPAVGDTEWDGGWISPLNRAIYPPFERRRTPEKAVGCPGFKKDSVWRRPDNDPATSQTVCPGHYQFGTSGDVLGDTPYGIVWWDPNALNLEVGPPPGIRREALIVKDVPPAVLEQGRHAYETWLARLEGVRARGANPSLSVRTATEWAASDEPVSVAAPADTDQVPRPLRVEQPGLFDEPPVVPPVKRREATIVVVDARRGERLGGARFGELVHAVLASASLDADAASVRAVSEVQGRILSAAQDEVVRASDLVNHVLSHEVLARARAAAGRGACRRETPVTLSAADGTLIEGIVDLAFEEAGVWTIIDYKTDREIAHSGEDRYRRQIALYISAIERATGQPANGVLVRI
ncbi:MAG TPA: UvrD-helicase domain-containing protein [Vicinamibacterales bacterium]|nr:UvrD-helicase domain-containing protein [Vicinamibacterales bacterium]